MQSEGSSQHELCTPAISHYLTLALARPLWQSSSPFSPVSFSNFYSLWLPHFPYLPLALPYCPALCSFLFFLHLAQTTADGRTSTDIRSQCLNKAASCFQEQPWNTGLEKQGRWLAWIYQIAISHSKAWENRNSLQMDTPHRSFLVFSMGKAVIFPPQSCFRNSQILLTETRICTNKPAVG